MHPFMCYLYRATLVEQTNLKQVTPDTSFVCCVLQLKSRHICPTCALSLPAVDQRKSFTWSLSFSKALCSKSRPKWTRHPHLFRVKLLAWQKYLALPLSGYWICHHPLPVPWTNVKLILPVVIFCIRSSTIALKELMLSMGRISEKVNKPWLKEDISKLRIM